MRASITSSTLQAASDILARPCIGEALEQCCELLLLGLAEAGERFSHGLAALTAQPVRHLCAFAGRHNSDASGVFGVGFAPHETELDGLGHEARGARLIDADALGDIAHAQGNVGRGEHPEQPPECGPAGSPPGVQMPVVMSVPLVRTIPVVMSHMRVGFMRVPVVLMPVLSVSVEHGPHRAAPPPQTRQRVGDLLGRVMFAHTEILHLHVA